MAQEKQVHLRVHGIVQGVFFRAYTKQVATGLGIKGFVQNMPDGSVEILAQGPEEKLKELIEKVKIGPPAASVERVDEHWEKITRKYESFEILR